MEENLQALLIDNINDYAIFALDSAGHVSSWNPGAQELKGYTAQEIIGQHFSRFYTKEDQESQLPQRLLYRAAIGGRVSAEGWRVRKDGSHFWALVVISAIKDQNGKLKGFAKVTRDLTERKIAEETRTRVAELQEAGRVREEFLAYISHEMRTPLETMQLQLALLRQSAAPTGSKHLGPMIERLQRSYDRLAGLVDSILEQAKIRTGRVNLRLRPVKLAETVATVVEEFRTEAEHKGLALVSSVVSTSTANTDAELLCVILRNLISNAVKFSERGTITISMSSDGHENRLAVRDEGVGIALEDQERIFEPFERLESVEHKHTSGFGLGLATSKKLGEALGARFEIKSEIGAGSTFTLIIPSIEPEAISR